MKLIRLTTREDTALFDSAFNAQLEIPANAKIALQSVSININRREIVITQENNGITYQIATNIQRNIVIPNGEYSTDNMDYLLRLIRNALNASSYYDHNSALTGQNKVFGLEWSVKKNNDLKVEIQYDIGKTGEFATDWALTDVQKANNTWRSTSATGVTNNTVNGLLQYDISSGNGYFRARTQVLNFDTSADQTGYIIGLTNNLDIEDAPIDPADWYIAIHVTATDATTRIYRAYYKGVLVTTTSVNAYFGGSVDNEQQELTINGNALEAAIYRTDGTRVVLITRGFEQDPIVEGELIKTFYPFMIFRGGSSNAQLDALRLTASPYGDQPTVAADLAVTGLSAPPGPPPNPNLNAPNFLFFESPQLANFLGFFFSRIPISGTTPAYTIIYTADIDSPITQEADAYIVEILSLPIDSYDSFSGTVLESGGQRRNILSVVPSTNEKGKLVYEPPYPTFINLLNEQPLLLRNIRARVVRNDYTPVPIQGLATLVLLID
jgi:hypothetical protein